MYQTDGLRKMIAWRRSSGSNPSRVSATVVLLGITSLLTDISSEMVSTVLPLYLYFQLGLSPVAFGAIDGLYQGATAIARLGGGVLSDTKRNHKTVAATGYSLSAVCKIGLLLAGSAVSAIAAVVAVDRIGKGVRTSPRDAMISLSSSPQDLGRAFGVHRALDTIGALLGPLIAFVLLTALPGAYDTVFVVSFCFAIAGLAVLVLFVRNPLSSPRASDQEGVPIEEGVSFREGIAQLKHRSFLGLALVALVTGVATISDAFIYLTLQRRIDFSIGFIPLLYVGTALVFAVSAVPFGRIADSHGRPFVFCLGYAFLALTYMTLLIEPAGGGWIALTLVLLGTYYACTDGVLMALGSTMLPEACRASGLALLSTMVSLARATGSVVFGAVWAMTSGTTAVVVFLVGIVCAMTIGVSVLRRTTTAANDA